MIMADTSVFLPELVRRIKAEKKLSELSGDIDRRRADWGKIYQEKERRLKKKPKPSGTRSRFL